jgi:hypothetical protein
MGTVRKPNREIESFFEYGTDGIEVIEEGGLKEMSFGEYLVERRAVTRAELLAALCEQDRNPGIPLGEVIAWLGYMSYPEVDKLLTEWSTIPILEIQ